ncbi:MAG: YceI family protein [Acidothermaceae bacterium]
MSATAVLTDAYEIDEANTRIGFAARYAMVTTVRGGFTAFHGAAHLDSDDPTRSSVSVAIYTESLNTGQAQRDDHLRSPDFLDVETYPEMLFQSTGVEPAGDGRYVLAGDLTICGVTRPVAVDFTLTGTSTDHLGNELAGFEGSAEISRADFGLTWNAVLETGGVLVGDEVTLQFDVALIRVRPAA